MSGSYELGYEDSGGNFVKAGEIEMPTENLSDPLIIRHEQSGETIKLDGAGLSARVVTADAVNTGSGYEWQDVLASRAAGTWYQAPSDRDIYITLGAMADTGPIDMEPVLDVNTAQSASPIESQRLTTAEAGDVLSVSARVPAGQYYRVTKSGDGASYSLSRWYELR